MSQITVIYQWEGSTQYHKVKSYKEAIQTYDTLRKTAEATDITIFYEEED